MNERAFLSFLGLAARAGAVVSGFDACREAIFSGSAKLILMEADLSCGQKEKALRLCGEKQVPAASCPPGMDAGGAIGKPGRKIMAITQTGFASKLRDLLNAGVAE